MTTNRKPVRRYSARTAILRGASRENSRAGNCHLENSTVRHILTANHGSMHALTHGVGGQAEWDELAAALYVAAILDRQVYGSAYFDAIDTALNAQVACGARLQTKGRAVYTGPEMQAVNHALDIHDEQVIQATRREMERAINTCARELADPHNPTSPYNRLRKLLAEKGCAV